MAATNSVWPAFTAAKASTDAALTNSSVKATPGAGKYLVVRQVTFSNEGSANSFALLDGSGGTNVLGGVVYLGANQTFGPYKLMNPFKCTADTALVVTTTATDHSTTIVEGSIE
jgi:hypothetical protein